MSSPDFKKEKSFVPIVLYIDYINVEYNKFLNANFENITPRDFSYLMNIYYSPDCSQRELADKLFVSEANAGQIIRRLEKNELVYRDFDENNKSRRIINLSQKGRDMVYSLLEVAYRWESKFFENYDEEDKKRFKNMIVDYYEKSVNEY